MQIELGKTYATRNGGFVEITKEDKSRIRSLGGYLEGRGSVFYDSNGRYDLFKETEYDLIEEIN